MQSVMECDATSFSRGALCTALQAEALSRSSTGTQTDAAILMVKTGTQTLADDVLDVSTAEAMVAEALCLLDKAVERERLVEACALVWRDRAELGAALIRKEEEHTEAARAALQTAKSLAAAEQAARQMLEQLLAEEAAVADAAIECSLTEYRARCQVEADLAIWKALASGQGGRGG